ncbi:MAG: FHA domain-containing protein [Alphaproteobacteria bacterium]|uniref:FHA domain-containing protein n=1 Tax=Candidatus Nitrobium versatile TaxID=2884831 RepID=A0A953LZ40_9BACT|nr:FHA domain-containing protein [Candidatus Nitrobium versatile]
MAKVTVKFHERVLSEVPLDSGIVTIGRKPKNSIRIDNLAVSGFHAKIFREGGQFVLEDMGSLNGTFVNGAKIARHILRNGDTVLIGRHLLNFEAPEMDSPPGQAMGARSVRGDETLVIDSRVQQRMLHDMPEPGEPAPGGERQGGFTVITGSPGRPEFELRDRVTSIGKSADAGIRLKGLFAPKVAALINRRREGYFINPVGSAGVRVNGNRIAGRYDLKDGDIVEVGRLKIQFYLKE